MTRCSFSSRNQRRYHFVKVKNFLFSIKNVITAVSESNQCAHVKPHFLPRDEETTLLLKRCTVSVVQESILKTLRFATQNHRVTMMVSKSNK